jgi:raffinose/stachyose/melibiose transport system substrate-binding protein
MSKKIRLFVAIAVAACGLAALAGCGAAPGGSVEKAKTGDVTTDAASLPKTEITAWVVGEAAPQVKRLVKEFEAKYPNISVNVVVKGYGELADTEKLVLSSNDVPDVMSLSGENMRPIVKANLLRPIDDYANAYGWTDEFTKALLDTWRLTSNGEHLGQGDLYAVSQFGELVGIYYNRSKLNQLGLDPPSDLAEFEADMKKAKAAGEIPLQFGNADQELGGHLLNAVLDAESNDATAINNGVFGIGDASYSTDAATAAGERMVSWADQGYFPDDYAGTKELTAVQRFGDGQGVFFIDGTWANTELSKALGKDLGFFGLPTVDGGTPVVTGGGSVPFAIPTKSQHADAAASFINFCIGEPNISVSLATSQLPALPVPVDQRPKTGGLSDILATWSAVNKDDTLAQYWAYATPDFWNTQNAGVQDMLAGKKSAAQLADELAGNISDYRSSGG